MAPLPLSSFHDLYTVQGGGSPVDDEAAGARDLTLLGSGTAPRQASYLGRRGAEFRSATFSATAPRCFATDSPGTLNASLYVSSKIQSFTLFGWVKPQKTGVSSTALTPLLGLFSANNVGATPWVFDQPCLILTGGEAGASHVIVSIFGSILDTRIATQTSGPSSTTPLADNDYSFIAVRVTGNSGTNNRVDAVELIVRSREGVVRVYALGEHKAGCAITFGATAPSDGQTFTVGARVYTWRTALAGTPATGSIDVTSNPALDYQFTVGSKTYILKAAVGPATKASATISVLAVDCGASTPTVTLTVGGYVIRIGFGTKNARGQAAGYLQGNKGGNAATDREDNAYTLHGAIHGDFDSNDAVFQKPAPPTSGPNAGKDWNLLATNPRNFTTQLSSYVAGSFQVIVEAVLAGVAGNSIALVLSDSTPILTIPGATLSGGTDAPAAYSILRGANAAATKANIIAAINAGAGSGTVYSSDIAANPEATASDGGGTLITLTSKKAGSAGNGTTLTQTPATLTLTAFAGGVDGATANEVLIGASAQVAWQNLADAINLTGTPGLQYGDPTTVNGDVTATIATSLLTLRSKAAGTGGNGVGVSTTATGAAVKDEFRDKTLTALYGGQAAPPFVAGAGQRPDNADLRLVAGGLPSV